MDESAARRLMPAWIVYWFETEIDGLGVRISGQSEDRRTLTIHTASVYHLDAGDWLATAFRLTAGEAGACIYPH